MPTLIKMQRLIIGGQFIALTIFGISIFGGELGWHPVPAILLSLVIAGILPALMVLIFGRFFLLLLAGAYGAFGFYEAWRFFPNDYWSCGAAGVALAALGFVANKVFFFDQMSAPAQQTGGIPSGDLHRHPQAEPYPEDTIDPETTLNYYASALEDLAKARVISPEVYLKAMLKLDPDFDPRKARIENLPLQAPQDDAKRELRHVYEADLISFEDFQSALDEID